MKTNYNRTVQACFIGYVVQAIVNNFVPLLFLTFQGSYGISLQKITLLVTFNFGIQLLVDLASIGFVDRIGYRASMILAHAMAAAGLILLTVLPECLGDPFVGLLIAVMIYAIGGGLLEVLVSPVVEACPTDNKEKAMSLLHSFYQNFSCKPRMEHQHQHRCHAENVQSCPQIKDMPDTPEIFMDKSLSEQYQPQSDNHQYQFISDRNDHQHQRRNRYWYLFFFHIINLCRLSSRCRRCDTAEEESNR